MHRLLIIIFFLGFTFNLQAQSPHGVVYEVNCASCHTSDGWEIPMESWNFKEPDNPQVLKNTGLLIASDTLKFNHYNTNFPLLGQHSSVNCRECHETLVFQEARVECIFCHSDMHQQTVGSDCARCHTSENWMVDNITELHLDNGFALLGAHGAVNCDECHVSESELVFHRVGNECVNCHLEDFNASTQPNHRDAGYSTNCMDCHNVAGFDWTSENVIHDFFPLTKGHEIADCAQCHSGGTYSDTPDECVACHQADYDNSISPNHQNALFSMDCNECHTTDINWMPADYQQHDGDFFPIYSGVHEGEWDDCVDCHANSSTYAEFTCISCHEKPETDEDHQGIGGYVYESTACVACHPTGSEDDNFDHNQTTFPLTGAHTSTHCDACHNGDYENTPNTCVGCHTEDYNQSTNPNHSSIGLPTDCESCHTTDPGWIPATFDTHNDYYALNGAHAVIANDCVSCHNGDYNNTPNTCAGCHTEDYNQTSAPNHQNAGFPVSCETCHTEDSWVPAAFDHDNYYVLDGAHASIANDCDACHNGDYENTPNTCVGCHTDDYNQTSAPNHQNAGFPVSCETCHTEDTWVPAAFDHDNYYVLDGAHASIVSDCDACHNGDYENTPNTCVGCHTEDYNQSTNPNHSSIGLPTDCESCHTT
ncbi:MAG: hypothetical protein GY705_08605, partial [Bacteroidetes bacterium]|nr:hypothetical protein [Bacteroidota bacterium]